MEPNSDRTFAAALLAGREGIEPLRPDRYGAFASWAESERLAVLVSDALREQPACAPLRNALAAGAARQAALAVLQERELRRVLDALAGAQVEPVLLKGAALAHSAYADPAARPRRDTDLLIREHDAPRVRAALEELGYRPEIETFGRFVTAQFHYTRTDTRGVRHACDVHLKIVNAQVYAASLSYDELREEAVTLRVHPCALGPSAVHALLVACIHRIAHHHDSDDLLWLHDVRLLARALREADWERLLALAHAKALSAVVVHELERAEEALGTCVAGTIRRRLHASAGAESRPPLLTGPQRLVDVLRSDLAALPTWTARVQLVREHLFPSVAYMRQTHPRCPRALLPAVYALRIVRGAPRWFR